MKTEEQIASRLEEIENDYIDKSIGDYESHSKEISLKIMRTRIKELRWVLEI
jgi:hypothetical protein